MPKFELTCNLTCNCDFNKYSPICGADGMIYFSPCHAGCSQLTTEKKETQFFNCDCIPSGLFVVSLFKKFIKASFCINEIIKFN